jgi:hypothetical protein
MANAQAKTSNELTADGKEQELTDLAAPLLTFDLGAESNRLRLAGC